MPARKSDLGWGIQEFRVGPARGGEMGGCGGEGLLEQVEIDLGLFLRRGRKISSGSSTAIAQWEERQCNGEQPLVWPSFTVYPNKTAALIVPNVSPSR
jgi:hypothetical protein